ncbi:hypothetical protein ASC76_19115 [Rhizobacter sp. Root404]|nr:hypothetical protein ASC76_19115 [Rhizobacter sp. Root404]
MLLGALHDFFLVWLPVTLVVVALTGCATTQVPPPVVYVTEVAPKVALPAEPNWVSKGIPEQTPVNQVLNLVLADLQAAVGYIDELKTKFKPFTATKEVK